MRFEIAATLIAMIFVHLNLRLQTTMKSVLLLLMSIVLTAAQQGQKGQKGKPGQVIASHAKLLLMSKKVYWLSGTPYLRNAH